MSNKNSPAAAAKPTKIRQKTTRTPKSSSPKTTKSSAVIALLSRPEGATIEAMMHATGWQAHSVRGFLAGTLKKKLGKAVSSDKTDAGRVYRLVEAKDA
jgi:hypothetical protein